MGVKPYIEATIALEIENRMCNNNKVISRAFYTIQLCTKYNER